MLQYGDLNISNDTLITYIGADPTNVNDNFNVTSTTNVFSFDDFKSPNPTRNFGQRDAHLIYLKAKVIFDSIVCCTY